MGNAHAYRGRFAPALILALLVALSALAALLVTENADARPTFEPVCAGSSGSCPSDGCTPFRHTRVLVTTCSTCHTVNTATPPAPSACAACHGGTTAILAKTTHAANACGTTPGCHGFASPSPSPTTTPTPTPTPTATKVATTVTAKVAPTTIRLGKTVKTTGVVTPVATLAGKKVALRVDIKKGTKWVKTKVVSRTVTTTGAYSWKYKPLKRGAFRVKASIAATATYKSSKTAYKLFKVK